MSHRGRSSSIITQSPGIGIIKVVFFGQNLQRPLVHPTQLPTPLFGCELRVMILIFAFSDSCFKQNIIPEKIRMKDRSLGGPQI